MHLRSLHAGLQLLLAMFTEANLRANRLESELDSKKNKSSSSQGVLKKLGKDGEFVQAVLHSTELWKSLFIILERAAREKSLQEEQLGETLMSLVIRMMGNAVVTCNIAWKDELERLLVTLTTAGMFDALDQALPICASFKDVPSEYSNISVNYDMFADNALAWTGSVTTTFSIFKNLVIRNPRLRTILRPQLPRQRTYWTLIQLLTTSFMTGALNSLHSVDTSDIPDLPVTNEKLASLTLEQLDKFNPNSDAARGAFIESGWEALDGLQRAVLEEVKGDSESGTRVKRWCTKRGCKNEGDKKCSRCGKAVYCSAECQKA